MKKPFLLLAEDDEDDRFFLSQAIASVDPSVPYLMVNNGREVLMVLENDFLFLPDYIFLDLNMPVMNGLECLTAIKQNPLTSSCTVIVYSTTMEQETENTLRKAGAFACFVKPTGISELAALFREYCGL